jgi:coenzyme F420-reducing hydrogenase gamma subunit
MELKYFLSMKDKVEIKDFDISLIEGVISTEKDKKAIEEIRANSKIVICMGTCAITGLPSGQRNNFSEELTKEIQDDLDKYDYLPKSLSIKEAIKTDDEIQGCPIDEKKFIEVFEKYLN